MTIIYDLIFIAFAFFYFPYLIFTGRYHKDFKQRFGILPQYALKEVEGKDAVWLHAVSVGEVIAARTLCEAILKNFPLKRLVISTVTKTGNDVAKELFLNRATIIYAPLDLSWVVKKFLDKLKPAMFIIMETEIWPNIITMLGRRNTPVIIANGRISPKSYKNYRKVKFIIKPILCNITMFCMQSKEYAERIESLGAPKDKIAVTGNMKFDAALKTIGTVDEVLLRRQLGIRPDQPVFIAGSTHPGEEEILLDIYEKLLKDLPQLKLVVAPRHIERTAEIENLAKRFNFTPVRISETANRVPQGQNCVFILDTIGKLSKLYSIATVVFMGGSLIPKGGQNILEPAVFGKAIVFGPNMFNFSDIAESFLNRNAACMVKDSRELMDVSKDILSNSGTRESLGRNAKEVVKENLGATQRNLEILESFMHV